MMDPGDAIVYLSPITKEQARVNMEKLGACDIEILDDDEMEKEFKEFESLLSE